MWDSVAREETGGDERSGEESLRRLKNQRVSGVAPCDPVSGVTAIGRLPLRQQTKQGASRPLFRLAETGDVRAR